MKISFIKLNLIKYSCLYCNGVAFNQCTKCSLGSKFGPFLLNGECLYPCPDGYF